MSMKTEYYHFTFKSGCNPYIAFSRTERDRVIKKFKSRGYKVIKIDNKMYFVNDIGKF